MGERHSLFGPTMGESCGPDFCTRLTDRSLVKAKTDLTVPPYLLPVSNFDHLSGRFPITVFYAYGKPPAGDFSSVVAAIKASVSEILAFFPPFAGRIVQNPESSEVEILCNNEGAELIVAMADVPLASLDLYHVGSSVRNIMLPFDQGVPLRLQVTGHACGGFSVAWTFDHLLADGAAFFKFLASWSEIARTKRISTVPNHDRSLLRPRSPPTYGPSLDRVFCACTLDDVLACPRRGFVMRLYFVEGSCVDRLRAVASEGGGRRTRTEALSAYIWKILARSIGDAAAGCKMGWLVDGRRRVAGDPETMSNYVGNLCSMAVGEASTRELEEGSLSHVAGLASRAIREVNGAHFMELADWIEGHRPGMVLARILMGSGGPAVVVSSCHTMPVMSTDFGFGPPLVATFYTALEGLGAGYVSIFSSGKGDGSWFVYAFVWPKLAAELDSDPGRVFQPITPAHLGL